jgi:hypothetical protein
VQLGHALILQLLIFLINLPAAWRVAAAPGSATGLVVLPGAVRQRARVGTGPDHRVLGAVRLPGGAGRVGGRRGRAYGGVLQRGAGLRGRCGTGRGMCPEARMGMTVARLYPAR